jgi:hypothetical protein
MDTSVVPHETADAHAYRDLVQRNPNSLVFVSPEWVTFLQSYLKCAAYDILAWQGGRLVGVLPLLARDGARGIVANSLPYYGSNGGCAIDPDHPDPRAVRQALFAAFQQHARTNNWLASTLITSPWEEDLAFYRESGAAFQDSRIGQLTSLEVSPEAPVEDQLLARFHQKTRNLVRKALKGGFTLVDAWTPDAVEFLVATHEENMAAIGGQAKDRAFFQHLSEQFPAAQRRLLTACLDGRPVASLLLLYFHRTVEYFTPVIQAEYRPQQPLSYLIFKAMCDAARAGYRWWNWGGTWNTQQGVYHFKSRWGAVDRPYHYFTYAHRDLAPLLGLGKAGLLEHYQYFYVLPFSVFDQVPSGSAA